MLFRQLFDEKQAVLVDPVLEQVERDLKLIEELNLNLVYCLETHIHADHITGTGKLRELTKCQGIVPDKAKIDCADREIKDKEVLQVGKVQIEAIATPGHTDSHMAYLVNKNILLTGDALFIRGCGRTDFQSGDPGTLYKAVTERLFTLPEDTLVYPGHDYRGQTVSTIGEEKQFNLRFTKDKALISRESFIEIMDNLNLANPKKMMEAVPANLKCGESQISV